MSHLIGAPVHYVETTGGISVPATATEVETALLGLNQLVAADISVSGGDLPGTPVEVEFTGDLKGYDVVTMAADGDALTEGGSHVDEDAVVTELTSGVLSVETALEKLDAILDATTLNGGIDDVQTAIDVTDGTVFDLSQQPLPFTVRVDNEDLQVTGISVNTLTVVRGHNGTVPTGHGDGTDVKNNVTVSGGDLPDDFVVVEFVGTLEHTNIPQLISDSQQLTEAGTHTNELADVQTDTEGSLSVETALERLPSIVGPETDINVVGGPLGDPTGTGGVTPSGVHIEFRGPVLGSRDIALLYGDEIPGHAGHLDSISITEENQGVLSVQKALVKLGGIGNGSVLVTTDIAAPNPPAALPFLPVQVEFTRDLGATDIPLLEAIYNGGTNSTAVIDVTTIEAGQRRAPLEIEFVGALANSDLPLLEAAIDEMSLVVPDDYLVQWKPEGEDAIEDPWNSDTTPPITPLPPSQDPMLGTIDPNDAFCFTNVTVECETFLTGVNEMQLISGHSLDPDNEPGSGSYRLSFNGVTTSSIQYNATAATVQNRLQNLNSIGNDNVVVKGGPLSAGSMMVEFVNQLANKGLELLEVVDVSLSNNDSAVEIIRYLPGDEPGMGISNVEIIAGGFQSATLPYDATAGQVQQELERMATIAVPRGQITEATNATPVIVTSEAHGLMTDDVIYVEGASVDGERTRLVGGVSQVGFAVTVEDGTAFTTATPFKVRVDTEDMIVTNIAGNTLTVSRGANGTIPTVHVDGRRIVHIENTVINGRREVVVINSDMFSIHNVGGTDVVGDGDYAGRGRWSKMGNVEVTGGPLPGTGMQITFGGDLSHIDVGELNPDGSLLT
ncbi:MAG: hypothetical protein VYA62_03660, partial [Planctomycetota bacterium]|nr:hypothetical protein [Planctomycetota bacterium]